VVKTVLPRSGKLSLARRFNAGIAMARVNIFVASRRSNPLASLRDAAKVMAAFVPAFRVKDSADLDAIRTFVAAADAAGRPAAAVMAAFVPALKRRAKLSLPLRGTSGPLSSVKIRG